MKIINPSAEYLEQEDVIKHVARCARVCYKREKGNDKILYDNLIKNSHWSMFRHATYYFIIPNNNVPRWLVIYFNAIIRGAKIIGININYVQENYYVVTNGNWNLDHQDLLEYINNYAVTAKEFANANKIALNMMRYTFKVITQISTSRELNRVSPNSIAEQSTRYVYEDGTICRSHWLDDTYTISETLNNVIEVWRNKDEDAAVKTKILNYIRACKCGFDYYKYLIDIGIPRQDARGVLPLDTATVCVYTYSWIEWEEIIKKRVYNTTGKSHPNATIICKLIEQELNTLGYEVKL